MVSRWRGRKKKRSFNDKISEMLFGRTKSHIDALRTDFHAVMDCHGVAGPEGEEGALLDRKVSPGWRSLITPMLFLGRGQARIEERKMHVLELQAISADNEFNEQRFTSFWNKLTGSSKGLIHPNSAFTRIWHSLVAVTVISSCLEAPFQSTFTPMNDDGRITTAWEVLHMITTFFVDLIYLLDIAVKFRTGYSKLGAVVMERKLIAKHYMLHGLPFDVIAATPFLLFPFEILCAILCNQQSMCPDARWRYALRYFKLLQLFKVRSAMSMIEVMRESFSNTTNTLITSMITLLVGFILLCNWFTCIWFIAQVYPVSLFEPYSGLEGSWLGSQGETDPVIGGVIDSWLQGKAGIMDKMILYINCFYWSSSAGDAYDTQNTSEKFVAILAQIVMTNGFMAFILASILSALEEFSRGRKKYSVYRSKIDAVNEFMRSEGFSGKMTDSVRTYYKYVWLPHQIDFTEANLHDELPPYLRSQVMAHITRKVLLTSKFMTDYFKDTSDAVSNNKKLKWIDMISEKLVPRFYNSESYVVRQGDIGTELYIIKQGKVEVEIEKPDGQVISVAEMGPGTYFGDIALLGLDTRRTASIKTITNCIIFELSQENMEEIWAVDGILKTYMKDVALKTKDKGKAGNDEDKGSSAQASQPAGSTGDQKEGGRKQVTFGRTDTVEHYAAEIDALDTTSPVEGQPSSN